jgi:hypothetical protein
VVDEGLVVMDNYTGREIDFNNDIDSTYFVLMIGSRRR